MIAYPAILIKGQNETGETTFSIEFPDLDIITDGITEEETLSNGKEALTAFLEAKFEYKFPIAKPSKMEGDNIILIEPDIEVAVPIYLRWKREEESLTQEDIAGKVGISYQAYQRLENPSKFNPTIKNLKRVAHALHKKLKVEFV